MVIDETVRTLLSDFIGIPLSDLDEKLATKIITERPVNLMGLITGRPPLEFPPEKDLGSTSSKLARVFNIILLEYFDSVEEFLTVLGADYEFITAIWSSDELEPKRDMIEILIQQYEVDPIFLYTSKDKMFSELKNQPTV